MSDTPSAPFATIDAQLGQIKADHAVALRTLQDQLTTSQIETSLAKTQLGVAVKERIAAEQRSAALQALFAVICHVLDEAKKADAPSTQSFVETNKDKIDATGGANVQT